MWLIAQYEPVALFSLRSVTATSSGAKTLLIPTPFSIRMALLDATIRANGLAAGRVSFEWIKKLMIAVRPPERVVVTNLFTKVLKPTRQEARDEAMDRTISFREYAQLEGVLALAFDVVEEQIDDLTVLLTHVNCFGKRGSFFQLLIVPQVSQMLPEEFVPIEDISSQWNEQNGQGTRLLASGLLQMMDDWGESLTFDKVNVFSQESIQLGKDRVRKGVTLPYRLVRSSKSFSCYELL